VPDFADQKALLHGLYGLEFPDSLFHFHRFLGSIPPADTEATLNALGMWPDGLLKVLGQPEDRLRTLRPAAPMMLFDRSSRDFPEFFSCLWGHTDGLHWGILLDEPREGFKGAASYYTRDADRIQVHGGLFDALLVQIHHFLSDLDMTIKADPEQEESYRRQAELLVRLREKAARYLKDYNIPLDEGREEGLASETGLSLVAPGGGGELPSVFRNYVLKKKAEIEADVRKAVKECERGRPRAAFGLGRSLCYWGGDAYAAAAYDLLRRAYAALDRPALGRILELHYPRRQSPFTDLFPQQRS
jgi:hypothetical protein